MKRFGLVAGWNIRRVLICKSDAVLEVDSISWLLSDAYISYAAPLLLEGNQFFWRNDGHVGERFVTMQRKSIMRQKETE